MFIIQDKNTGKIIYDCRHDLDEKGNVVVGEKEILESAQKTHPDADPDDWRTFRIIDPEKHKELIALASWDDMEITVDKDKITDVSPKAAPPTFYLAVDIGLGDPDHRTPTVPADGSMGLAVHAQVEDPSGAVLEMFKGAWLVQLRLDNGEVGAAWKMKFVAGETTFTWKPSNRTRVGILSLTETDVVATGQWLSRNMGVPFNLALKEPVEIQVYEA